MATFVEKIALFVMGFYYSAIVLVQLIKLAFKHGPGFVFGRKPHPKPAVLDDPSLGTHGFLQLEHVKIHYVASGPEDKPLMLFLHGFPEFWYSWRHQIREFQNDYRCVAIDQRGYGESDKPEGVENYYGRLLVEDIKNVIHALGREKCILVAHDWGGILSWGVAHKYPNLVERLIVLNAAPSPIFGRAMQTKEQRSMSWYVFFFQLPNLPERFVRAKDFSFIDGCFGVDNPVIPDLVREMQTPLSTEELTAYKYMMSQPGTLTSTINWYRALFRQARSSYTLDFPMPVLVIWGMKDVALSTQIPELIEKESRSDITVRRVHEAGHFVQTDTPDRVNEVMRDWLSTHKTHTSVDFNDVNIPSEHTVLIEK